MSKVLKERGFGSLPSSTETNPRDQVKSISTTIEVDSYLNTPYWIIPICRHLDYHYCKKKRGTMDQNSRKLMELHISNNAIPRKEKDPGTLVLCLSTYLNLGLGELAHTRLTVELADRTVKYPKGIAENVLVGIGKFTFPVDFIILDMPEDSFCFRYGVKYGYVS
ncbi:hypothetical protein Tco_0612166 [Tanacetum coccineum]